MKKIISIIVVLLMISVAAIAQEKVVKVKFTTSFGDIHLELYPDKAPVTVENFVKYVESGYYDNTVFHRIIPGFVVQGGGLDENLERKDTFEPIKNEADNGLLNDRGTISMARTMMPHSATSQFFLNLSDNHSLNHYMPSGDGWGYAVFGKITEGMDVLDKLAAVETGYNMGMRDVPVENVFLIKAEVE